jgi:hypothetical protein
MPPFVLSQNAGKAIRTGQVPFPGTVSLYHASELFFLTTRVTDNYESWTQILQEDDRRG